MSDAMLRGVLEMPYEMAMASEISRRQFYGRAQQALAEIDALRARIEGAMVVKATRNGIVRSEARMNLIGKRVALVVLEDGK